MCTGWPARAPGCRRPVSHRRAPPAPASARRPRRDLGVVAATERGVEVDQVDPLGTLRSCQRCAAARGSPNTFSEPATPWTGGIARPPDTSTAGSSCNRSPHRAFTPPTLSSSGRDADSRDEPAGLSRRCWRVRAVAGPTGVTVPRKREELAPAPGVNQVGSMSQTSSSAAVSASTTGSVCTTVEAGRPRAVPPHPPGRPPPAVAPASRSADRGPRSGPAAREPPCGGRSSGRRRVGRPVRPPRPGTRPR